MTRKKSDSEKKLAEVVRGLDESAGSTDSSSAGLTDSEVLQLEKAQEALDFLRQIRDDRSPAITPRDHETAEFSSDLTQVIEHANTIGCGETLGRFEIQEMLGQGGFSRVFLARDPQLDRLVALKVPLPGVLLNESFKLRFEREAKSAAILSHPSIVPTFESGNVGPVSYIAMGYVKGCTLDVWFEEHQKRVPYRVVASIVAELANAIEHAHQRGIVHRDIKPANVLVEAEEVRGSGDNPSTASYLAGRLRITDFGLAKALWGSDDKITMDGSVIGTPAYMSPEQARGEEQVTPSNDIFSLGTLLYELLTGQLPFQGGSHLATLTAIQEDQPTALGKVRADIPKDLEAICLRCLKKDASERYQTAFELEADLRRWLRGLPIHARTAGTLEKLSSWRRRNPRLALSIAAGLLATLCGLAGTTWQWQKAIKSAKEAQAAVAAERTAAKAAQEAKEEAIAAARDSDAVCEFLTEKVLGAARPKGFGEGLGGDVTLREALEVADPEAYEGFHDKPLARATAHHALGTTWRMLGKFDRAAAETEAALRLRNETKGEDWSGTLLSEIESANLLVESGKLEEAEAMFKMLHGRCKKSLRKNHPLTIGCINNLAIVMMSTGRYSKALPMYEDVWNRMVQMNGMYHDGTLQVTRNYALSLRKNGYVERSRELLEDQVTLLQDKYGASDYRTIAALGELATSYTAESRIDDSQALLDQAIPAAKKHLGMGHPRTLDLLLYEFANLLSSDRIDEAMEAANEVRSLLHKEFGSAHYQTQMRERDVVFNLMRFEYYEEALEYLGRVLPELSKVEDMSAQRTTAILTSDRGRILGRLGQFEQSNQVLAKAVPMLRQILDPDHEMIYE
ncbi:MAG: serine/threonine-protein kinase, partial [Planctomycetota bacterium]